MFTPKKIQNALARLFDLFDAEIMEGLYENYGEEIEDISPRWLAKAFKENASPVYEYRAVCCVGDGIDYTGKVLFQNRGVRLLSYLDSSMENDRLRVLSCTELWLLEDMTFAVVQYVGTMVKGGDVAECITEYRRFMSKVKTEDDVFFDPEDLICSLDDTCMIAQLYDRATVCKP